MFIQFIVQLVSSRSVNKIDLAMKALNIKVIKQEKQSAENFFLSLNIRVGYRRRRFGGRDDVISKEVSKRD
ncbi:hypothetical protein T08_3013 [Trichinella sp. T8]|nr:hypothetical protein T08_3013 [Trichinella sp. T8]